jgi:hypothetical protein
VTDAKEVRERGFVHYLFALKIIKIIVILEIVALSKC